MTRINYTYIVIGLFLLLLAGFVVWIILTIGNTGDSTNPNSSIPSNLTVTHTVGPVTKDFGDNVFTKSFSENVFTEDSFTIKKSSKSLNNEYNFFDVIPKAAYTSSITISGQGTINWGDGVTVNVDNKTPTLVNHVYQSEGSYTVIIKGKFTVLGLTTNDNPSSNVIGNLTVTDVVCGSGNSFTTLICNSPVQTFTGLTKLPNLTEFQLGQNTIELDFNNYPKLTAVGLSDKGYGGDFDISTLRTSITSVYLNDNNITSVTNLSNLPNLVNLFLNKTSISTLDLSSNKKLQQLGLDSTNITSLGFISNTDNPNITYLDISNCNDIDSLTDTALKQFTNIKTLILNDLTNLVGEIDLTGLTSIISLSFKGCTEATNITVNGCTKLVSLDVTGCEKITGLSATGCKVLTNVIVKGCFDLTDINFANCTALTLATIDFQTDLIQTSTDPIPLADLTLTNCTSVINLDLTKCENMSALDITGCTNISELLLIDCNSLNNSDVGGTIIKSKCPNVTKIKLTGSAVTNLDVSGLQKLVQVVFNGSAVLSLDASDCPVLTDADVGTNPEITTLDVSGCPSLIALYTYTCPKLTSININNCSKLTLSSLGTISDANPDLESFTCNNCLGITTLDLHNLDKLETLTFTGCSNITTLNLSGCSNASLGITSTIIFNNCPKLSILDVSNCVLDDDFAITSQYLTSVTANNTNIWNLNFNNSANLISVTANECNELRNVYLGNCSKLTTLNITDCTNALFTSLGLAGLAELTTLNLIGCDNLLIYSSDIKDNCPKLSVLDVSGCLLSTSEDFAITSANLTSVSANNTVIVDLDLNTSVNLTQASVLGCPDLQNVYLSGCTKFSSLNITSSINVRDIQLNNCNMNQGSADALVGQIDAFVSPYSGPKNLVIQNQTGGRTINTTGTVWGNLRGKGWTIS